jgi:hypothetical protein
MERITRTSLRTLMGRITPPLVMVAVLLVPSAALAIAPQFVSARIEAAPVEGFFDKITYEPFEETLTVKGMVWEGTAAWYAPPPEGMDDLKQAPLCEGEDFGPPIAEASVKVEGVLLTQGTQEDFARNPGILTLKYTFTAADGTSLGTAEGFVTLRAIEELWGSASFSGTVTIDGQTAFFSGTGESRVTRFIYGAEYQEELDELAAWKAEALAELAAEYEEEVAWLNEEYAGDPAALEAALAELAAWYEEAKAVIEEEYQEELAEIQEELGGDTLSQRMGNTVLTAQKPGFSFEGARRINQVNKLFNKANNRLQKERRARIRVIQSNR